MDPTGHKSRKQWEQEFRDAHNGQDPTDQDWWDYQFSIEIADWSAGDWLSTIELRAFLYGVDVKIISGDASWTLSEVVVIEQVISNIATVFGGDISRLVGGVTFKRNRSSQWPLGIAWTPARAWCGFDTIHVNDSAFDATLGPADHPLTHELGHYFQRKNGLIDDFRKATGGSQFNLLGAAQLNLTEYNWGGTPPNTWAQNNGIYEDFAASFETYVYHMLNRMIPENVMGYERALFFDGFAE